MALRVHSLVVVFVEASYSSSFDYILDLGASLIHVISDNVGRKHKLVFCVGESFDGSEPNVGPNILNVRALLFLELL